MMKLLQHISWKDVCKPYYVLNDGLLYRKDKLMVGKKEKVIQELLQIYHDIALGGHSGMEAALKRLKMVFF